MRRMCTLIGKRPFSWKEKKMYLFSEGYVLVFKREEKSYIWEAFIHISIKKEQFKKKRRILKENVHPQYNT